MVHRFQEKSVFALIAATDAYTDLPEHCFQLSDGTWVMPRLPVADKYGAWAEWLGSIRLNRLKDANLVLLAEEASEIPGILGGGYQRLTDHVDLLLYILLLGAGIEISHHERAERLAGSSLNGVPEIKSVKDMPRFYRTQGLPSTPITRDWLEECLVLCSGYTEMMAQKPQFRRTRRGLDTLFKGKKEEIGQDRLHQFVRSLEALILPRQGKTTNQFAHRCQTFARAGEDTRTLLLEAFSMRSATEHLNQWEDPEQSYTFDEREALAFQRTRQMEHLACDAYSRLLRNPALRDHFRTDDTIAEFWKLPDSEKRQLWGTPLDLAIAGQS